MKLPAMILARSSWRALGARHDHPRSLKPPSSCGGVVLEPIGMPPLASNIYRPKPQRPWPMNEFDMTLVSI